MPATAEPEVLAIENGWLALDVSHAALAATCSGTVDALPEYDAVAVPHTLDVSRRLSRAGVRNVRSPITTEYDFKFVRKREHLKPYQHQIKTADFAVLHGSCFVLNDPGTGKTASLIWAWHYLFTTKRADRLVIFCPRSVINTAWYADVMRIAPELKVGIVRGTPSERERIINSNADVLITNHDAIVHTPLFQFCGRTTHVILDEASAFGGHDSERSQKIRKFCSGKTTWVCTATPCTQSPERAWALCQIVNPKGVPPYFTRWRNETMYSAGPFKWKPKACAADMLYAAMQPAIRFSKDECLDLPGVVYLDRHVPLSVAQNKFIKQMATDWLVKDGGVPVTAVHAASRVSKILQACSGVVKRDDGTYMHLETGSRIAEIMQIMDDSDGKVIVFCKFRGAIAHIVAELNKQLRKVLEAPGVVFCKAMTGDTTDRERAAIVDEFQDEDSMLRVLVAQPITAAHGLTLTAANAIVWYTPFEKAEYYIQGNERTDRPGQTRKTTVYHLSGSPFEDAVYASVAGMVDYESSMLDLYALASKSW